MMRGLMRRYRQFCAVASIAALIAGCAVGPNYKRPELHSAPSYKEVVDWKPSEPSDALSRGPWWEIFKDDELNALEGQINISNENVKAAAAAVAGSLVTRVWRTPAMAACSITLRL